MIQEGDAWQPATYSRRSIFDLAFARSFILHLQAIEPLVIQVVEEKRRKFQDQFDEVMKGTGIDTLLRSTRLSEEKVSKIRAAVLDRPRVGRGITILNDPSNA